MDAMFMEPHFLRSPLRLYSELDAENNNSLFSAAMMEKARVHLQMWGRTGSPHSPADLHSLLMNGAGPGAGPPLGPPHMYGLSSASRGGPPSCQLPMPLPAHLWASGSGGQTTSPWSSSASVHASLPPGLLGPPPPPPPNAHSHTQLTPPPPPTSSSSSSGSPSPSSSSSPAELRLPRPVFPGMSGLQQRYSPYHLVPKQLSPPATAESRNWSSSPPTGEV